jgi:hypothetical protein
MEKRAWPQAFFPALLPGERTANFNIWVAEEGEVKSGETGEQHQLLPFEAFLKEQSALSLKGRGERARTHTHTHTHTHTPHTHLAPSLPFRTHSSPGEEAARAPTSVNTPSGFLVKPIKSISHGAGSGKMAPARRTRSEVELDFELRCFL